MTVSRIAFGWSIALALALALIALPTHALRVEDIPTPRPAGWVTDQANLLSAEQETELNRLGESVHAVDGAELAIVTVRTTGGEDARAFATRLFNHWAIGEAERDNGVLLFVAIDDRAAELVLGDGVDTDDQVGVVDDIMQRTMVPQFKAGAPDRAIVDGARETARRLLRAGTPAAAAPALGVPAPVAPAPPYAADADAGSSSGIDPALVTGGGIAGGGGLLALVVTLVRRWWRNRPRPCKRCGTTMQRLGEAADDAHLTNPERAEERVGSVDYDVWMCPACAAVEKFRYGALFTRYARCPQCSAVTKSSTSTTLTAATTSHGGVVRVDERCESCGYTNSFQRSTPRISTSSSSSSSGFGGGSSSGRGSSGRW